MQTVLPRKKIRKRSEPYYWYFLLLQNAESFYLIQNSRRNFLRDAWLFPDLLVQQKLNYGELISEFQNRWGINLKDLRKIGSVSHSVTFRKIEAIVIQPEEFEVSNSNGKWISMDAVQSIHTSSILKKIFVSLRSLFQHSKLIEAGQA